MTDFFKRRWWILVLTTLVAGLAAYYVSSGMVPIYRASTIVLVNQTQSPGVVQYNDVLTSERLTSTYAQLVKRSQIMTEVIGRLGLRVTPEELAGQIHITPIRNTQLLRISAENADRGLAANIANTTSQVFIDDNAGQLANRPGTVSIAEQAAMPSTPVSPNIPLNTIAAVVLGLLIGAAIAFVIEYFDDTVKDSQDVEDLAGLSTLGVVSRFSSGRGREHSKAANGAAAVSHLPSEEEYRQLRTNIHFSLLGLKSKVLLITSSNPREGKSTTAYNLATVLAQAGHRVILVDADLRRPSLHTQFGTPNSFGITGLLLSGSDAVEAALVKTSYKNLSLLPSGPIPPNPSEVLMSQAMQDIIERIRSMADYVILDSPPVLAVTDARILAGQADATILVVETGRTRTEAFHRAYEALRQTNARVIGAVLNKTKQRRRNAYYYGYYGAHPDGEQPLVTAATTDTPAHSG